MSADRLSSACFSERSTQLWRRPSLQPCRRTRLQVQGALSRKKKEEIVAGLKTRLEESMLVFGMPIKGLTVPEVEEFRGIMNKSEASVFMCKNSLIVKASEQVEGWDVLKEVARGDNAWVFTTESQIAPTIKAFLDFEEKQVNAYNDGRTPSEQVEEITKLRGGVLQGKVLDAEAIKELKDLPTMDELYAKIGGLIKMVPTKLGIAIKQIPTKVAVGIRNVSELDENKDALVGDFVKSVDASE